MSDISQRIASLSPEKRALLEKRLAKKGAEPVWAAIPRLSRETDRFPSSFAQQRLWFLEQFVPGIPLYNMSGFVRFTGPLNRQAIRQSLEVVVERHEALRTTFATINEQPVQVVSPTLTVPIDEIDLGGRSYTFEEITNLAVEEARRPFDLTTGPLCRIKLLCLAPDDHVVVLTMHHIISDGTSTRVLFQDTVAVYEALVNNQEPNLPELPIQYVDFAAWQRDQLQDETLGHLLRYWKDQLSGELPVLQLPIDRPRPAVQTFVGARQNFSLSPRLTSALRELSQREGVTLFMVLLASFQTLLARYTGQDDILVGSPIANRNRSEIEKLVGFFVNTLVLRTDLSGNPTFRELLKRVQQVALGAYTHEELPFEKLVEELQPERNMSHTPLFQVLFGLQSDPTTAVEMAGLTMHFQEIDSRTAKCDITLMMTERPDTINAYLEYNTDLFDAATMTQLIKHLETMLQGVVDNPGRRLSDIPLLTDAERHDILVGMNNTRTAYPADQCVHTLFEAQAMQHPDAPALIFGEQQLTYGELNDRANRLAHHLRTRGIGTKWFVAVFLERSADLIVGILAILKAGGTYVPLDITYPKERLSYMLEDTQAAVLLTQEQLRGELPAHNAEVVCIDTQWAEIAQQSGENPVSYATPANLAYMMYTSGSTGNPKGVLVPHRGITRLVFGVDYACFGPEWSFLQLAPIAFDASTLEIWGALLHGARCVIYPDRLPTAENLGRVIRDHGITSLWLTSSLFNMILDEAPSALTPVRQLLVGGEALSVAHIRRALDLLPDTQLINGYGPTESTTFTCCYPIPRPLPDTVQAIPIGRPIGNTSVYILDQKMQPVPVGVPGELYIGGDGLAREYYQRPTLTAERFVPHPFSDQPGERLYRTGDLVRYLRDGTIDFLGRTDHQVKIRGFRIELGEIETTLATHPAVRAAVVLAREDSPGERRLVAYLVPLQVPAPDAHDLRAFLQETLPDHMVPSLFVTMDALPLTPNGKADRGALPVPDGARPDLARSFVAPTTPVETTLASIWCEVLKLESVGVEDNFFDLGGYSLAAVQVASRVRETLQVELALRSLFETPTVASLAQVVAAQQTSSPSVRGPALLRIDRSNYRVQSSSESKPNAA